MMYKRENSPRQNENGCECAQTKGVNFIPRAAKNKHREGRGRRKGTILWLGGWLLSTQEIRGRDRAFAMVTSTDRKEDL
jgi:hypothetical protein